MSKKYFLIDANLVAGFYLPRSLKSVKAANRIEQIINSVFTGGSDHFFYVPNICVAEVFNVFTKHAFGKWNNHVTSTIDKRVYESLMGVFRNHIHNGKLFYHYELSRYHVLGIDLVCPVDHYFQLTKKRTKDHRILPSGTFDHLIISMGIQLAHVHGRDNFYILTADDRLARVLDKCKSDIPLATVKKLKLEKAKEITGKSFSSDIFPRHLNLKTCKNQDLENAFGSWPPPMGRKKKAYRFSK